MSKYTTGELAKMCGITVRTVQYYDTRGILIPSELSDGGRRLYNDDDVKKMQVICFLRDIGLQINTIAQILEDDDPQSVVALLIEQHEATLTAELEDIRRKLDSVSALKNELKSVDNFSVNTISDIAHIMKSKEKMKKVRVNMAIYAVIFGGAEIATALLWILKGLWLPFAIVYAAALVVGLSWLLPYYYKKTAYICPSCHEVFKPTLKEMFWANHTPKTRKLTCPHCDEKKWCVETYDENSDKE